MYGLSDIASPFIQFRGTMGECFRAANGMGLCEISRREKTGWVRVAVRYFDTFTHVSKIVTVDRSASAWATA